MARTSDRQAPVAAIMAAARDPMSQKVLDWKGGNAFKKKLAELAHKMGTDRHVEVGFLEGATYPAEPGGKPLSVAQVAFWNEFGTKRSPPRPFFRNMVAKKSPTWGKALAANAKATNFDGEKTLSRMGEGISGQLQQSINEFSDPPLKESTVARKGFSKPLIDTSHMIRSVDFQVLDGNGA